MDLPKDKKPFQARINLGRSVELQPLPRLKLSPDFKGFRVKNFVLLESRQTQNGVTYHAVRKFNLLGA